MKKKKKRIRCHFIRKTHIEYEWHMKNIKQATTTNNKRKNEEEKTEKES